MPSNNLWVEKYRPSDLNDVIIPDRYKNLFTNILEKEDLINFCFHGLPGTGKTTIARILCKTLDLDFKIINASDDRGIDVIRTTVNNYAKSMSMNGKKRVIIMDEAEKLTVDAQCAFKKPIEDYSKNCRFIFITNDLSKINEALVSRLELVNFTYTEKDKKEIRGILAKRIFNILESENIKFSMNKKLAGFITHCLPDIRGLLKSLQRIAIENNYEIPVDYDFPVVNIDVDSFKKVISGPYKNLAEFVNKMDPGIIFKFVGDNVEELNKDKIFEIFNCMSIFEAKAKSCFVRNNIMICFLMNLNRVI